MVNDDAGYFANLEFSKCNF